jgi:hypothetical protein
MPTSRTNRLRLSALAASLAVIVAACAGGATSAPAATPAPAVGTTAPSLPAPSTNPMSIATAPSAWPSVAPSLTPMPSVAALKLLWQKSGPAQKAPGTYWPAIEPLTGHIWVASGYDSKYWIFNSDGTYLESWGTPGAGPGQLALTTHDFNPAAEGAIAFAPDGSFYVLDTGNYRVEKFGKNRQFLKSWGSFGTGDGQFVSPKGIATDGNTVYVTDDPRADIQAFDTEGKFLRSFPFPFVLFALAPNGHLFVGDSGEGSGGTGVDEFDATGRVTAHFAVDPDEIQGGGLSQVAVDKAGHLDITIQDRVAPASPFELLEMDAHGALLHKWSGGGETNALAPDGSAMYSAYTGPQGGWSFLRKYALPKP